MPRYFFHLIDGHFMPDETGSELPSDDAARAEAVRVSGGLLQDLGEKFWDSGTWVLQVVRDDGGNVCELKFEATTP